MTVGKRYNAMKNRVLSMLLAFILCFSTLPMTALAQETVQEADVVTEQAGPAAEQEEAEAAAAPGAETPADKSTTAAAPGTEDSTVGEATDTVKPTGESVSDSDAGTQDTAENGEKAAEVQAVQKLIDALPETVTEDNAESVSAQLEAIAEAMESLTEEQIAELDMEHLYAISEAMSAPMTVAAQDGTHADHPVCGTSCTDDERHDPVEWTGISSLNEITEDGNYYLKNDISDVGYYWKLKYDINLCLNGHNIKTADNKDCYIDVNASHTLSLCNPHERAASCIGVWVGDKCKFNLYDNVVITRKNNSGVWINYGGTFTMNGGTICNSSGGVVVDNNASFIMNNGRITENTMINSGGGGGVRVNAGGNFTMTGGKISENTATDYGGGVYVDFNTSQLKSGTFTVSGNAKIIDNKVGNSKNNVALCDGSKITIAESGLGSDASIGVSLKKDITEGSYAVIASGANNSNADKITSDSSDYKIQKMGDELLLCTNSTTLHTHPVCGTNCTHTGDDAHSTLTWQGISALSEIKKSGNY